MHGTSVNLANVLHLAATSNMIPASNPNNAWASGTTRRNLPRSTSVEYEKETQTTYLRRLAPSRPPSRPPLSRRPTSKNLSVPESEGENAANSSASTIRRGKSPFEQVVDAAKNILEPATYYVRQLSLELEDRANSSNGNTVNNISYDYSTEEREFEDSHQPQRVLAPIQKRGRMPLDNRAYEPPVSDIESADDDYPDEDKRRKRRKKKKNDLVGGPYTTLPVLPTDRKKKRKNRGNMSDVTGQDDEKSESDDETSVELVGFCILLIVNICS